MNSEQHEWLRTALTNFKAVNQRIIGTRKPLLGIRKRAFFLGLLFLSFLSLCQNFCSTTININDTGCILMADKTVKCWGKNNNGMLGLGDTDDRGNAAGEMGDYLPFVDFGGLAISVIGGFYHSCVQMTDLQLKCWGRNIVGQLGLGDINDRGDVAGEMGDYLPTIDLGSNVLVVSYFNGGYHTIVITDQQKIKVFK